MNQQGRQRTLGILESFGPISLDRFDDRLRMQKLAFLIQGVGGYHAFAYYWHVRGPYSPDLTRVLFSRRGDDGAPGGGGGLAGPDRELAGRVRSLVHGRVDDALELELYASVWYLAPEGDLPEADRRSIIDTMEWAKPHFKRERVAGALAEIEAFRRDARTCSTRGRLAARRQRSS